MQVFLPCRLGSERVKNKNTRKFAFYENGLLEIKLKQLLTCDLITSVCLSTNDPEVMNVGFSFESERIKVVRRSDTLASSSTSTDSLMPHVFECIPTGDVMWTHVTSPFVGPEQYRTAILKYYEILKQGHDSLMSVTKLQTFIWDESGAVNYDRSVEKWPRTQTLDPLYEVNSAFFIQASENYKKYNDRIGVNPFLYAMDHEQSFDIDWQPDFEVAERKVFAEGPSSLGIGT